MKSFDRIILSKDAPFSKDVAWLCPSDSDNHFVMLFWNNKLGDWVPLTLPLDDEVIKELIEKVLEEGEIEFGDKVSFEQTMVGGRIKNVLSVNGESIGTWYTDETPMKFKDVVDALPSNANVGDVYKVDGETFVRAEKEHTFSVEKYSPGIANKDTCEVTINGEVVDQSNVIWISGNDSDTYFADDLNDCVAVVGDKVYFDYTIDGYGNPTTTDQSGLAFITLNNIDSYLGNDDLHCSWDLNDVVSFVLGEDVGVKDCIIVIEDTENDIIKGVWRAIQDDKKPEWVKISGEYEAPEEGQLYNIGAGLELSGTTLKASLRNEDESQVPVNTLYNSFSGDTTGMKVTPVNLPSQSLNMLWTKYAVSLGKHGDRNVLSVNVPNYWLHYDSDSHILQLQTASGNGSDVASSGNGIDLSDLISTSPVAYTASGGLTIYNTSSTTKDIRPSGTASRLCYFSGTNAIGNTNLAYGVYEPTTENGTTTYRSRLYGCAELSTGNRPSLLFETKYNSSTGYESVLKSNSPIVSDGTMTATAFYESSDRRLKSDIEDADIQLDDIDTIPVVNFKYVKDDKGKTYMGTIAQDIVGLFPELVSMDKDGMMAVDYSKLSVVAIAGVKRLRSENEELKNQISALESLVSVAFERIEKLEKNGGRG